MKRSFIFVFMLSIISTIAFSFSLNFEGGYLYNGFENILDLNLIQNTEYYMLPIKFSTETSFEGAFYTKSSIMFDSILDNSYIFFEGDFYTVSLPIPVTFVDVKEAYGEVYTNYGELRIGKFIDKLYDSEVFNVYDKIGKRILSEKFAITGLRYNYTTNYGVAGLYVFSTLETVPSLPSTSTHSYEVVTNLPDEYKLQILATLGNSDSQVIIEDPKFIDRFAYAANWTGNIKGLDYSILLTYQKADYLITDKISEDGVHLKWPFIYTGSLSLIYQVPNTSFIVHNYSGFVSGNSNTFKIPFGTQEVEIKKSVANTLEDVLGVEYQIGSNGLIGLDGYVKLSDFEYDDSAIAIYGNYTNDKYDVRGMVKYEIESEEVEGIYELSYEFDSYTKAFVRGLHLVDKENTDSIIMVGLKSNF